MWNNIVFVVLLGFLYVDAQIIQSGQCDNNVTLEDNFNINQFLGTWYEIRTTETPWGGDCATIELIASGNNIIVHHKSVNQNFLQEEFGTASVESGTSRISLSLPQVSSQPINFWIQLTDYDNYALAYGCQNVGNTQRQVYFWQLSRNTTFLFELVPSLLNQTMIDTASLTNQDLREINHGDDACYLLPDLQAGQPIVVPGSCNENILGLENFDVARFLGVWHEVNSYYSDNVFGTCGRAQYSDGGSVVNVVNSQINSSSLLTIEGFASLIGNDGRARLNVTLEVLPGVIDNSELFILGTDYDQWAVSYTCVNLQNNTKQLFSWIVSRTRVLPESARNEVNQVISSYVELNQAFYQTTDQSDDGCFYAPEPQFNQPVIFGGQCAQNVTGIPGFDASLYLGSWYEIEAYPSLNQTGSCAKAEYSLGDDRVEVVNTQVVNQALETAFAWAVPVENSQLLVSFPIPGTNVTIDVDYVVLATDYSNYSLVYSCSNINDYQQRVSVWKLGRSKQLSINAEEAINNATLDSLPVIQQRYFQPTDQSDEACFYLPEPNGEVVRIPGRCEQQNISVVQSFNLTAFAGVWYEVQAYPKDQQQGVCINHQFAVNGSELSIESSSVVDQLLSISLGSLTSSSLTSEGRFILSVQTSNGTVSFPYDIIATDYNDYALAYSCVNDGDEFMNVYSWKLSRSPQLSPAAINSIANATANILIIDDRYFETVRHDDDACFSFPENLFQGSPVILDGQCGNVQPLQNFSAGDYLGRWFLIDTYPSDNQGGSCSTQQLNLVNGLVEVVNSQVVNQTLFTDIGIAQLSNDSSALLEVNFPNAPEPFQLYVLDTNYNSYSLVYGCVNLSNTTYRVYSWKMSRSKSLSQEDFNTIQVTVDSIPVLNNRYYVQVDQSTDGCFYYPPVGAPTVVFPGQCDENIQVVDNFSPGDYTGLWYDILSYPLPFQMGDCPNARYSIGANGVDVFNTQVINQTLDTIDGLAVLANASSTEAKLIVSFPSIGNFTSKYWVLDVDYNDYAIVYSCLNIDDEHQQISSWVLSRSKSLSANATAAYENITSTVQVLDDRYYIRRDQSDEGCFYYPTPEPGKPVVFNGQCDSNVTVVDNFDMNRFSGVWFEIETYPKVQQTGECVSHEFSIQASDTLGLQSFSVISESLGVTNGVVSRNDTSGRLSIYFSSNGTNYEIPYWVIDTDYENYALVYSCVNNDDNTRGVWSWKLSRSKELSNTSAQSIATASANIDVLQEQYYEPIDQSEGACFYLPDLAPGEPVIFSGQCPNISALPNFAASQYLGRWFLIETYPSDNQGDSGSCNTQQLNLVNGLVEVVNSQVVNQTLFTDIGIAQLSSDSSGLLEVNFPNAPEPFLLYVLDTNYVSYALVYGCVNLSNSTYRVFSWKMSRSKSLNQTDLNYIQATVDSIPVLNNRYYVQIDQSTEGCFYYPPVGAPTVVFPGQCDENIQVVDNFSPGDYTGLWYDILSYPLPFQMGDCPNARYSIGANGVDVFNTQVINQTLDTIDGLAVLANASSTEAKLIVSFPSLGNFTSKYWVLDVDYNDYAIVYSCLNIDDEQQQISSWVLSRSKSLSANASAAYENITSTIRVLDDRYYIRRDQSDEGCFYFPTPEPGKPVVFNGQCDSNVSVVDNLDMNRFSGVWFEIETYPKVQQTGECVSHEFSIQANNDTLGLQSFNVIAESLGVTNGVVSRNDTSGRLSIYFTSNGTNYEIPYWVIDTDYDNYALVYSCVDNDDNTRGVWSWKLSRSKELSNTSIQNIASASASIDVLQDQYYEPIDQSDQACFYLPDLAPGEPVVFPGQCANISAMPNFVAASYLGVWKLIETYPSNFQNGACGEAYYSLGDDGSVIVSNSEVVNQTLNVDVGSATLADSGVFVVTFPNNTESLQLLVLDTDYISYSIVYACSNVNSEQRRVFSWKLSRTNTLTATANAAIEAVLNRTDVLNQRYYVQTDRSAEACFYYPEPTGAPVRFRAQCDQSIPVVTDFNPVAYEGLWHDIGSYPTPDQGGQCSNAHYTLGPNGVDVFNTQVINQTLDTISGVAVLANASSTEAKLLVNFPSQGNTTSDYWVLATDYSSYALVYSCFNIDDEYMFVFSWKLSRTRSLSANATNDINNAIDQVPVLANQYYLTKDQSDEACFYFPNPQPGVPVRFPGICDANVPVVQNFNLSRFQGTWYEIETYPKDQQTGQCISHEFTVSGNSFDLISNNVMNGIVGATNSTVDFAATNETSGRFVITIQSSDSSGNITLIEIPYWIVDTDYDNYALAYSCVDLVNERGLDERGVYSWKLSRTKGLSTTYSQAIDNAAANIDVIDNRYFEQVRQDDDACFYVPDLNPGDPIIFSGQCDRTIPGVANFNATRYLGTWNLIEDYASDFQFGTCADTTYSLTDAGSVEVVNTEVINQTLSTMIGSATLADGNSGVLIVTFPNAPPIEYVVLDTDYDSYSIVYSCENINPNQRRVYSWKLSRTGSLSATAIEAIDAVINNTNVLVQSFYQPVNRSYDNCFYYPEPSDYPVEFRGSCDPNVAVMPNFAAGNYTGRWNLIEYYPSEFQRGTCATADYTAAPDGTVIVVNQEVVNQTLLTDTGVATVVDNAKLSVIFPNAPEPIDYWVLDTDYNSYSLVYSCVNLPNNRRRVFSWKLSRSDVFPNVPSVDAAINQVDVLDNRYYRAVDRSDEACFYLPEPTGNPVEFIGQCDPNVAVVQNFNAGDYLGKWNLIENYPSEFQRGTCATAEYSMGQGETVVVLNQEVVNQTLFSDIGVAIVIGNAKLSVTFPDAPTPIEYWVLDTDYTSYSIVYSCVNISETRRRVYSWKLSRDNSLSQTSINAINAVMNQVNVLDQRYYEVVDRSDAGCFYYPEPSDNPVILPGSCDTTVQGVQEFNIASYAGTWYQIERYPQTFEDVNSNCAGARYEFNEDEGVVNVVNWEVVNGTIWALEGTAVPASGDGSAHFIVTLPDIATGNGTVQSNLYVLATDYQNYSLAYSCANLEGNRRSIGAWKLSRGRDLSPEANATISTTMATRPELRQQYFRDVEQNDECPEPEQSSGSLVRSSIMIVLALTLMQYFV